jgi:CheY-like chemotaxis protein
LAKFMIEHLGYEGTYTRNGEEAIERYRHAKEKGEAFDAVILDLTVQGGMGGEKAMAKLLEADPAIKAVISSGYADDPVMKDFRKYGFVAAIPKPYTMEQLQELLEKL